MQAKNISSVFLSSTARDLSAYREKVAEVINRLDGFKCVRMEEFGARESRADEFCRTKIKQCDIAVFIVGLCHGSSPDQTEDSYTAREYQEAVSAGVSRLVFLSEEDFFYSGYYRESDEQWQRQQAFRKRLGQEIIRDTFATPEELASKVSTALGNWAMQQTKPSPVISASLAGSGALAVGNHAVAASDHSIAVGGHVGGNVQVIHASDDAKVYLGTPDPTAELDEKLARYYRHLAIECRRLPLEVIDSKFLDGQEVRLPDIYVPLHALRRTIKQEQPQTSQEEEKRLPVLDAFAKERRAVLLGEPGSGKTVLVNYLAGCLAEAVAGGKLDDDIPDTIKHLLPIRLILREVAAAYFPHSVKAQDGLLWQAVRDDLSKRLGNSQIDEVFNRLQTRIRQTGALFFLDGLDEVPESGGRRKALLESVRQLADNWKNCRFLVTARPYAYAQAVNRLTGFPVLELVPFDEGQRNAFIAGWYRAMQSYIGMSAANADYKAQSLQTAAQRPELVELASRPLLLTLMATLHTSRGTLPKDRAKLYDDSVELLLGSWQRKRLEGGPDGQEAMMQVLDSDLGSIRKLMEQLAYQVHERQRSEGGKNVADITEGEVLTAFRPLLDDEKSPFKSKALLDYLDTQAGLLIARAERGPYAFPHRSFQEYLAASHLCRRSGFPKRFRELAEQDALWWREVFLLGVGAAGEGNLADMINALVPRDADKVALPSDSHWRLSVLAGLALGEQNVKDKLSQDEALQAVYERVQAWLVRFMSEGRLQAAERAEAGTVLGQLGDPRFDPALWHLPAEPLLGFRPITAGVFTMGSDKSKDDMARESESPPHSLELPGFFMARWPVTVAQFAAFVQFSSYAPQSRSLQGNPNHPVVYVNWQGAIAYCQWLNERLKAIAPQRLTQLKSGEADQNDAGFWQGLAEGTLHVTLPSEAEWEVAARGTDGRRYPWGNEPNPQKANYGDTGINETSAVGCFPAGISPFGVEDLSGNVWEWTRSLWGDYPYPKPGEQRQQREDLKAEGRRVLRGGAFIFNHEDVRCASRINLDPDYRYNSSGFRVVVSPFL
ncbi:MAG: SUMF1/EgtB/PvdO family nonheme iron enzyme [Candidatus Methylumidiphilus sp.]